MRGEHRRHKLSKDARKLKMNSHFTTPRPVHRFEPHRFVDGFDTEKSKRWTRMQLGVTASRDESLRPELFPDPLQQSLRPAGDRERTDPGFLPVLPDLEKRFKGCSQILRPEGRGSAESFELKPSKRALRGFQGEAAMKDVIARESRTYRLH